MDIATEKTQDFWSWIEKHIKKYEAFILCVLLVVSFSFITFKILSYGYMPSDDALRHIGFAMLDDPKWSDVLVVDDNFNIDHNAGWHQVLRFTRKTFGLDQYDLLSLTVGGLFLLLNLFGVITAPSAISWCIAFLLILVFDGETLMRMLRGRPYIVSCITTLVVLRLWAVGKPEDEKQAWLRKGWVRNLLTVIAFSLGVWIHGTWYIFLLIPFAFLLAGKTKEALKLTGYILLSTIIGALLTGHFFDFLYYHFVVPFKIYSEDTYNSILESENWSGRQSILWMIYFVIIIALGIYKNKKTLNELTSDPVFMLIWLCWAGSIYVIRFWVDWGRMALLFWTAYRVDELIKSSASLQKPRVRYALTTFIFVCLVFLCIHDGNGRFSETSRIQPIDFYGQYTGDTLKGWAPEPGGIVYNDNMGVFHLLFFSYPKAPWKYIRGFETGIMKPEDKKVARNIDYYEEPEAYMPWVEKMTEKDRIITAKGKIKLPGIEWKKASRYFWIGRLEKKENK